MILEETYMVIEFRFVELVIPRVTTGDRDVPGPHERRSHRSSAE